MADEDSAALLRRAMDLYTAGDASGAAALYRRVAAAHPEQPTAWALLGGALADAGDPEAAVEALDRAARLAPDNDEIAVEYAVALRAAGRAKDVIVALSSRMERLQESERAQAVLAEAYREMAQWDAAMTGYRRVLALSPGNAAARVALGTCQQQAGDVAGAIESYRAALALDPDADEGWSNLGLALKAVGEPEEAIAALRRAVTLNPRDAAIRCNLGVALLDAGQNDEAAALFEAVTADDPDFADAWSNLGNARQAQCRLGDALAAHDRAVVLAPDNADYHWNRAMTLLLAGEFAAGFAEYEWRDRTANHAPPVHDSPIWQRGNPAGKHVLLQAEQGYGDTIQFARYAPVLQRLGAEVTLRCPRRLTSLLATLPGAPRIVAAGDPLPPVDCHVPLMSLPQRLGTGADSIPADIPYLTVPAGAKAPPPGDGRRRVGLCWTGNPGHPDNRERSFPLSALTPLLACTDIEWISLQFGPGAEQAVGTPLADWSPWLDGFADTAAALATLDLIISVDTATAHLAGALGRPVWLMLKFSPDWRWMLAREDSPWYPTMRLFRQEVSGDWSGVATRLGAALDVWMEE